MPTNSPEQRAAILEAGVAKSNWADLLKEVSFLLLKHFLLPE